MHGPAADCKTAFDESARTFVFTAPFVGLLPVPKHCVKDDLPKNYTKVFFRVNSLSLLHRDAAEEILSMTVVPQRPRVRSCAPELR